MTGRERFRAAIDGRDVAFAPLVWERLDAFVHQPTEDWWREPGTAQRLLADLAGLARADATFVAVAAQAATALRASGASGDDALDQLAGTADARGGCELVARLAASASFAVIAGLPGVGWLQRQFGAEESEAAEDALSDLARGYLEAGADGLAVIGADPDDVRRAAGRARAAGDYYGRPVLAVVDGPEGRKKAWLESGGEAAVAMVSEAGGWPTVSAGLVLTPGDVSVRWDTALLHAVGSARR